MGQCATFPKSDLSLQDSSWIPTEDFIRRGGNWINEDEVRYKTSEAAWAAIGVADAKAKSEPGIHPEVLREIQEGKLVGMDPTEIILSRAEMTSKKAAQGILYGRRAEGYRGRKEAEDIKDIEGIIKAVPAFKHRELAQTVLFLRDPTIDRNVKDRVLLDLAEYAQRFFGVKEEMINNSNLSIVDQREAIKKLDEQYRNFFVMLGFNEQDMLYARGKTFETAYAQMKRLKDFMEMVLGPAINVDHHTSIGASGRRAALDDIRVMVSDIARAISGRLNGFKNLKLLFERLNKGKGKKRWNFTSKDYDNMFSSIFADAYQQSSTVANYEELPFMGQGLEAFLRYAASKGGKPALRKEMMQNFNIHSDIVTDFFRSVDKSIKLIFDKQKIQY
jgi:hypothetical protein